MIFGFNTDIKHGDIVYHVQSEARLGEHLLQTQVFVRGRCMGKHAKSYAEQLGRGDFCDEQMHELLKAQHRSVIGAIREGRLEEMLGQGVAAAQSSAPASPESQFTLELVNHDAIAQNGTFVLRFRVAENRAAVEGARLICKLSAEAVSQPVFSQAVTDSDGVGELRIAVAEAEISEASVLVQATRDGRTATRKIILRNPKQEI